MERYVKFTGEEDEKEFLERCLEQWELTSNSGRPEVMKIMELATVFSEMRHRLDEVKRVDRNKQYAHCMNCDYETESMSEKNLIHKISMEGGYIQSDKDGGYYSRCPGCESGNLSLMSS